MCHHNSVKYEVSWMSIVTQIWSIYHQVGLKIKKINLTQGNKLSDLFVESGWLRWHLLLWRQGQRDLQANMYGCPWVARCARLSFITTEGNITKKSHQKLAWESVLPISLVKLVGESGHFISLHSNHKVSGDVVNICLECQMWNMQ